jgi:hypothetical protein
MAEPATCGTDAALFTLGDRKRMTNVLGADEPGAGDEQHSCCLTNTHTLRHNPPHNRITTTAQAVTEESKRGDDPREAGRRPQDGAASPAGMNRAEVPS